ncbi:MAG: dTDP-4-dehydrorhamnose reductase [Hyphomicrobiaceae bacterium]
MRLMITGWQGQVARAFLEAAPGRPEITACALGRPALDICNIRTIERSLADVNPDVVINTAGYTAVDEAESDEERSFALNRDGALLIAEAAARRGLPIIHLSSDYVFDGRKTGPYLETDTPAPLNVYGRSKLEGELAVAAANERHIILRTSWIFSPFGRNFVTTIRQRMTAGGPLAIVHDQRGNPTYAPDLVDAILSIASAVTKEHEAPPQWGTYHASGSEQATWYDVAVAVRDQHPSRNAIMLSPIPASQYPTKAARPANATLDCSKLRQHFGITLSGWRSGLERCLERIGE